MPCPETIREELISCFDHTLETEAEGLLLPNTSGRTEYLAKWARYLKDEAVIESVFVYTPEEEFYARGLYWSVRFQPTLKGLVFSRSPEEELSDTQQLINAGYKAPIELPFKTFHEANLRATQLRVKRQILIKRMKASGLDATALIELAIMVVLTGSADELPAQACVKVYPAPSVTLQELDQETLGNLRSEAQHREAANMVLANPEIPNTKEIE